MDSRTVGLVLGAGAGSRFGGGKLLARVGGRPVLQHVLDTLAEAGIVEHLHVPHGPGLYVLTGRGDGWAACERCGAVERLGRDAAARLREAVRDATGFEAGLGHCPIVGVCPECRS